jgi:hypothetical protein
MRRLIAAVGLALCAGGAQAADFGLGVSVRSDDGWIYVPIDISKSFRIEPTVRYSSTETSGINPVISAASVDSEVWEAGIGVFGLQQIDESAHLYYGGRVAYLDRSLTSTTVYPGFTFEDKSSQDGYSIGRRSVSSTCSAATSRWAAKPAMCSSSWTAMTIPK